MAQKAWPVDTGLLQTRLGKLRASIAKNGLDALAVTDWDNLYYLTSLQPIQAKTRRFLPMPFVVSKEKNVNPVFIAPSMYKKTIDAENKYLGDVRGSEAGGVGESSDVARVLGEVMDEWGIKSGTIGLEYDSMNSSAFESLRTVLPKVHLKNCTGLVEDLRMVKTPDEVERLKKASRITEKAIDDAVANVIRPGVTELDIARAIISSSSEHGADGVSFFPQVFSGYRSSLFNTTASYRRIERGDSLLLDFGVFYEGYATDITRVVSVGKLDKAKQGVFDAVEKIVEKTISTVRAGISAEELHQAAITQFENVGYNGYCVHSTGHGIGLSVWERPFLKEGNRTRLRNGMTLAIEQGIYLAEYGFRLEQNLVIEGGQAAVFNGSMAPLVV